jgi:hypothetical protein
MMPLKKSAAEECCARCEKDIAALKKEIAALKKEVAKKPAGGADPRVDKLLVLFDAANQLRFIADQMKE